MHKIIVKQYKVYISVFAKILFKAFFEWFYQEWASGYAKRMVLVMNGHTEKLSPVNNDYNTAGMDDYGCLL